MNNISIEERSRVYARALAVFGPGPQLIVALEELSEVQKEICKALRGKCDREHLAEEIADATIMLEQLRQIFAIDDEVCSAMNAKIIRLRHRIQDARENMRSDDGKGVRP